MGQPFPPAPRAKGPLVWLDMDQQALDDASQKGMQKKSKAGAPAK